MNSVHALTNGSAGSGGGGWGSEDGRRNGQRGEEYGAPGPEALYLPMTGSAEEQEQQQQQQSRQQMAQQFSTSSSPTSQQYHLCQWMPVGSESTTQLMAPPIGYGQMMDPWAMQMGYASWVGTPYVQHGMQSGMGQCFIQMPQSPTHDGAQGQVQVIEEMSAVDALSPVRSPHHDAQCGTFLDASACEEQMMYAETGPLLEPQATGPLLSLPDTNSDPYGMVGHPVVEEEDYLKRQHNHYLRQGMRTPSSLGSPPLSAAPTEAPSPRGGVAVEAASGDGSVYGSSDDVPRVDPALALEATKIIVTEAQEQLTLPSTAHMDYAMQFVEAPSPCSPARMA